MKSIKIFGLTMLAALTSIAFIGTSPAGAESTALCTVDESVCSAGHMVTSLHEVSIGKIKILNSIGTVECDALFSGKAGPLAGFQEVNGSFTYSSCKLGGSSCTVKDVGALGSTLVFSKWVHETATVTGRGGEGEVYVECGFGIKCEFASNNLVQGTAKGPLLSSFFNTNGEIVFSEQSLEVRYVGSLFCPKTAKLDMSLAPLSAIYISS
jgi:hypothetical protein